MLHGEKLRETYESGDIKIESINENMPFSAVQISEDSVDLRLGDYGYIINDKYEYINTLSPSDLSMHYEKVSIPEQGFLLKPHQILFAPTLEKISLTKSMYCARLTGRSVFARMGLSVHCTQDKFTSGMDAIVPLQIINNNSNISLKIYPYQKIAQLIIEKVSTGSGTVYSSRSQFATEVEYKLPNILDKEREQYKGEDIQESIKNDNPPENRVSIANSQIENYENKLKVLEKKDRLCTRYFDQKLGQYKAIVATLLSILIALGVGILALDTESDAIFPLVSWIMLIVITITSGLYFGYNIYQIKRHMK